MKRRSQREVLTSAVSALIATMQTLPEHLRGKALVDASEAVGLDLESELRAWVAERAV